MASMVPHAEPTRLFASDRSSRSTRFGTAASDAGSNVEVNSAIKACSTKISHTVPGPTKKNARTSTARTTSAVTMRTWRFNRSASTPATGTNRKYGTSWATRISDAISGEFVRSRTRPYSATSRNQSPPKEINWAR